MPMFPSPKNSIMRGPGVSARTCKENESQLAWLLYVCEWVCWSDPRTMDTCCLPPKFFTLKTYTPNPTRYFFKGLASLRKSKSTTALKFPSWAKPSWNTSIFKLKPSWQYWPYVSQKFANSCLHRKWISVLPSKHKHCKRPKTMWNLKICPW